MSHYFSHAFKNKQWVVMVFNHSRWWYKMHGVKGSVRWQDAKLYTRSGAMAVAGRLQRKGFRTRIKYQSIPSTRNMYR